MSKDRDCQHRGGLKLIAHSSDVVFRPQVPAPPCLAACDAEANGTLGITDYVRILRFSFAGGNPPDPPFPDCVTSTLESDAALGCETRFCPP